jgi:hypothetical protein
VYQMIADPDPERCISASPVCQLDSLARMSQ